MKKILFILVVFVFIFSVINQEENKEIKVRIIPNSNNIEDLNVKEEVKKTTIYYLAKMYDGNYDKYICNINETYKELEKALNKKYNLCISFDEHTLYNKSYNNTMVKNNECKVLYVIIGEGKGDNWWGSIYPSFLEINSSSEIEYESLILELYKKIKEK